MITTATIARPRPSLIEYRDSPKQGRRKYANEPTTVDGIRFDSKAEAKRYFELRILEKAGVISGLQRQVRYVLVPKQARPSGGIEREKAYVSDFVYVEKATGRTVVEDVKGAEPAVWGLKRALMLHVHGIEIRVVRA